MLPFHPQPKPDEILSSWMVRLALENTLPVHTFYNSLLEYHGQIWTRDIDRHPPQLLVEKLSFHTRQSVAAIKNMALTSYEGKLFETLSVLGDVPWLIAIGIYHRSRMRLGMQFCPRCLASTQGAYYKKTWRLALSVVCEEHLCPLSECCPACQAPIVFHRHGVGRAKRIAADAGRFCSSCFCDLGGAPPMTCLGPEDLIRKCAELTQILSGGASPNLCLTGGSDFLLFKGLRVLVGLVSGRHGEALRNVLSEQLGFPLRPLMAKDFEYQTLDYRLHLMMAVAWLLEKWPERFIEVSAKANLTRSRVSEIPTELPFWIVQVIDANMRFGSVSHSVEEIDAAMAHLLKLGKDASWQNIGELLGMKRDAAKNAVKHWLARR